MTRAVRSTRQRAAVSALLDRLDDFRSAQEIHEQLRRGGDGIGLTTVYRTLQALADGGEVDVLRTWCAGGAARPSRSRDLRSRRGRRPSRSGTASPTSRTPSRSSGCVATVRLRSTRRRTGGATSVRGMTNGGAPSTVRRFEGAET